MGFKEMFGFRSEEEPKEPAVEMSGADHKRAVELIESIKALSKKELLTEEDEALMKAQADELEELLSPVRRKEAKEKKENPDFEFQRRALDFIRDLHRSDLINAEDAAESLVGVRTEESLAFREDLIDKGIQERRNVETCGAIMRSLKGLDSPRAWELRDRMKEYVHISELVKSLIGIDSDRAWKIREKYVGKAQHIPASLSEESFLLGLDSDRAWEMRDKLFKGFHPLVVAMSMVGLDSDRAWQMRKKLIEKGKDLSQMNIFYWLRGMDSEKAWVMREVFIMDYPPDTIIASLRGLDSEKSWEMRSEMMGRGAKETHLLSSIEGLDSEKAWKIRESLMSKTENHFSIANSLAGLDSDRAWEMRFKLMNPRGLTPKLINDSLAGLDSMNAWAVREAVKEALIKTNGSDFSTLAKSITKNRLRAD